MDGEAPLPARSEFSGAVLGQIASDTLTRWAMIPAPGGAGTPWMKVQWRAPPQNEFTTVDENAFDLDFEVSVTAHVLWVAELIVCGTTYCRTVDLLAEGLLSRDHGGRIKKRLNGLLYPWMNWLYLRLHVAPLPAPIIYGNPLIIWPVYFYNGPRATD